MIMKAFTLFGLASSLDDTPPGFGVTVSYRIIEGMIETLVEQDLPSDLLVEFQQLAREHNCDFRDWKEHRFVQFEKRN